MTPTQASAAAMERVRRHRDQLVDVLEKYQATEPMIFGSVARGDATAESDVDVMVTLTSDHVNPWMQLAGLAEEFSVVLGMRVDVVALPHLRPEVTRQAFKEAVPL
ncbi:MAG: nucleotidyltransferase domain-containing protein [Propionibacteriaceae bacterium]|jgi:predicted nucleotidyltransferase|nr:nucleotidyltransferase domain-containing protein [Propionibacteriaceae bacterium]